MNRQDTPPIFLLVAMMAVSLPALFGLPLPVTILLMILYVGILTVFSLVHGSQILGARKIMVFFCISAIVTYLMEWIGTHFGSPFGHYYYTSQMGPLIMEVPLIIPLQWFNILYACYIMGTIILGQTNVIEEGAGEGGISGTWTTKGVKRAFAVALIVGIFMVSWDFINDPYMVGVGMWVWTSPNEFFGIMLFGIPLSNFLGWIFTSVVAILLFETLKHQILLASKKAADRWSDSTVLLVIVPYLYTLIYQAASGVIMGVFSFASIDAWGPTALAAICMGLATILVLKSYFWRAS